MPATNKKHRKVVDVEQRPTIFAPEVTWEARANLRVAGLENNIESRRPLPEKRPIGLKGLRNNTSNQ